MAVSSATNETKSKFGVPVTGATGSGILMPKLKYRFRVSFLNNFGGNPEAKMVEPTRCQLSGPIEFAG